MTRRNALVTGAGRGIGRAAAIRLAERGLDVALVARSVDELEETRARIEGVGQKAAVLVCDVSKADDVDRAVAASIRALGSPDVVVSAAGVVHRASVEEMTEQAWDEVLTVNLKGLFLVTRACLPAMRNLGRGRFVAIASISSTLGTARQSAYVAAKWGVVGFTKSLAEELRGSGLQTIAIMPGSVATSMLEGSGFAPQMTADDVARLVAYAALDAPDAMNGSAVEMFGP